MIDMGTPDGEKQVNVTLPEVLWDTVERLANDLRPWSKKLLVAAALTRFLELSKDDQDTAVTDARGWGRYTTGTATNDEVVDQAIAEIDEEGDGRHDGQQQRSG